jgi:hypothetical protein
VVAIVLGALLLPGCGRDVGVAKQASAGVKSEPSPPAASAIATPAASAIATPAEAVKVPVESECMPPDVEIAPVDTLVNPGESVEIVVRATLDATRVTLADGSGETQPFVRDPGAELWRVTYRVPLRPRHERWGLSVTARTDANRWRRVWVFLRARDGTNPMSTKPDTTGVIAR